MCKIFIIIEIIFLSQGLFAIENKENSKSCATVVSMQKLSERRAINEIVRYNLYWFSRGQKHTEQILVFLRPTLISIIDTTLQTNTLGQKVKFKHEYDQPVKLSQLILNKYLDFTTEYIDPTNKASWYTSIHYQNYTNLLVQGIKYSLYELHSKSRLSTSKAYNVFNSIHLPAESQVGRPMDLAKIQQITKYSAADLNRLDKDAREGLSFFLAHLIKEVNLAIEKNDGHASFSTYQNKRYSDQ